MTETLMTAPLISSVAVSRLHWEVWTGQAVTIGIELRSAGVWEPARLTDAAGVPTITLFNPAGTEIIHERDMERVSIGRYRFVRQTQLTDMPGLWTARVSVLNLPYAVREEDLGVFVLRRSTQRPTDLQTYNLFAIRDQSGKVWYWWFNMADELESQQSIPATPLHLGVLVDPFTDITQVPYVLYLVSETNEARYLYPLIYGSPNLDFTAPTLATPFYPAAPLMMGMTGRVWVLSSNIAEEVIHLPSEPE